MQYQVQLAADLPQRKVLSGFFFGGIYYHIIISLQSAPAHTTIRNVTVKKVTMLHVVSLQNLNLQ